MLLPNMPNAMLAVESTTEETRKAAVAAAGELLSQLPLRLPDASVHLLPAFESVPAESSGTHCVDRVVALPLMEGPLPQLMGDGSTWLCWVAAAAVTSAVFAITAHAVNRVKTYRQSIPRAVLDDLMAASTRLRSGARETKRLAPPMLTMPNATSGESFERRLAHSLAADEHLRRLLLSTPSYPQKCERKRVHRRPSSATSPLLLSGPDTVQ